MTIYLIILICSIICCFLPPKVSKLGGIVILTFAFVISAFRDRYIGADTYQYLNTYQYPFEYLKKSNEYIFGSIVTFFYYQNVEPYLVQIFMAILTYFPLLLLFLKHSRFLALSVLVFIISSLGYYFETFNIVRQIASLPYILWAYIFLQEKKIKKFILFIVIAIGLHSINLLMIPFIFLAYYIKISWRTVVIGIIVSLFFAFVLSSVSFIQGVAHKLESFEIVSKYSFYANYKLDQIRDSKGLIILLLPQSILCLISYKSLLKANKEIIARLYFYGCVILNILSLFPTSYRMGMNLIGLELLIYPFVVKTGGEAKRIAIFILICSTLFFLRVLPIAEVVPYQSFL